MVHERCNAKVLIRGSSVRHIITIHLHCNTQTNMAVEGSLWSNYEVQCLMKIWADVKHSIQDLCASVNIYMHAGTTEALNNIVQS